MKKITVEEFSEELVKILPQLIRGITRSRTDALSKGQVSAPQYVILDLIYNNGPMKMNALAGRLSVSSPAMSRHIDKLYKMKMVERDYGQKDRRVIRINITQKGKKSVDLLRQQRRKAFMETFGKLSAKDRQDYLRIISKVKDILEQQDKDKGS